MVEFPDEGINEISNFDQKGERVDDPLRNPGNLLGVEWRWIQLDAFLVMNMKEPFENRFDDFRTI